MGLLLVKHLCRNDQSRLPPLKDVLTAQEEKQRVARRPAHWPNTDEDERELPECGVLGSLL